MIPTLLKYCLNINKKIDNQHFIELLLLNIDELTLFGNFGFLLFGI
jgi:hypothetical protein